MNNYVMQQASGLDTFLNQYCECDLVNLELNSRAKHVAIAGAAIGSRSRESQFKPFIVNTKDNRGLLPPSSSIQSLSLFGRLYTKGWKLLTNIYVY
jgi:hypothetical protein